VFRLDNESHTGLVDAIDEVARTLGIDAHAIETGFGPGDAPDLGGGHLHLLRRPRIAVIGRDMVDPTDYGAIWHTIDHVLGVRASYLDSAALGYTDLREYNTIVIPNASGSLIKRHAEALKQWVEQGGTLIAIGGSASAATEESAGLAGARSVTDSLGHLEEHAMEVIREAEGYSATATASAVYTNALEEVDYPWVNVEELPSEEELKRRDSFQRVFMPQGAILAARVDDRNWLTVGLGDMIPVLYTGGTTLMAKRPTQAPVRFGVYVDAPNEPEASTLAKDENDNESSDTEKKTARRGFAPAPIDTEPRLRMSGLLWPEAAQRLMNTAYLTRDSVGSGQVILFASPPTFRGTTFGTTRLLHNALIYGPGCGTSQPVRP
jgi:hypothetical protein